MNFEAIVAEIHRNPYDNAPRLAFAELIEPMDPAWARYVRAMVEAGDRNRVRQYDFRTSSMTRPTPDQTMVWARYLMMYLRDTDDIYFHRGFPAGVRLQPAMFIEHGADILRTAPIRHVRFIHPRDEDGQELPVRFPLAELLACPHLAKLDTMEFERCTLPPDAGYQFAQAETLRNCLYLGSRDDAIKPDMIPGLASGEITRRMLTIGDAIYNGIAIAEHQGADHINYYTGYTFREEGKVAEREHGYIPWLHERPDWVDLRWHYEQGHYPKIPVGTKPVRDEWYVVPPNKYERSERW